MSDTIAMKHPKIIIKDAHRRYLAELRGSQEYKYLLNAHESYDPDYHMASRAIEDAREDGYTFTDNETFVEDADFLAQYDLARSRVLKYVLRHALSDSERGDIQFMQDCYPYSVAIKGAFIDGSINID